MPLCCSRRSRREDYDSESDDDLDEKPAIERKSRRSSGGIEKSSESRYDKNARLIELQPNGRLDWLRFVFRGTFPIWLRIVFVLCDLAGVAALGYSLDQDYWKIKKTVFLQKGMKLNKHFDTPIGVMEGIANDVREAALGLLALLVASLALVMCCEAMIVCMPDFEHKTSSSRKKWIPSLRQSLWTLLLLFVIIWVCIYEVITFGGLVYWPEPLLKVEISVPVGIEPRLGLQINAAVCAYVLGSCIFRWWSRDSPIQSTQDSDFERPND